MKLIRTNFKNLYLIKKDPYKDKRGYFSRDFCKKVLKKVNFEIKQTNISFNKEKYTLRGFHYNKKPYEEGKIISCVSGKMLNVCIDLRKKSKTYLKVFSKILSEKNMLSINVPKGFANAYFTLENNTKVLYYMDSFYKKNKGFGIRYNDNFFSIKWPYKPKIISGKDLRYKNFKK